MVQPAVNLTELDGQLGILPPTSGKLFAVTGVSTSGPTNTPSTYARTIDVKAAFGSGPLVEAACHYIEQYSKPVVIVRTGQTNVGSATAVVFVGTGTSVVTEDGVTNPDDDYQVKFLVVAGGTIGVAGITFKYSLDDGRTYSAVTALGTANNYSIPGTSTVKVDFAAGTLVAGDSFSFRTNAPRWDDTELGTALDALKNWKGTFGIVEIVGDFLGADLTAAEAKFASMFTAGKPHSYFASFRMPTIGETEAAYKTAFDAAFGSLSTVRGSICAGAQIMVSAATGRQYRRPVAFIAAARQASVEEDVNIADVNLGTLPCRIRDDNGNPLEHDESVNPGLDDSRALVLRTVEGEEGVYVNRPLILAPSGSDFSLHPYRLVLDLAYVALRAYFTRRLNKEIEVDRKTGFILEREAREIETGALAAMRSVLLAKPKASGIQFALSRTDNVLSTKTLTGEARVIPLGYPEFINLSVGFLNPALQVIAQ